jgi:hypothetical protein
MTSKQKRGERLIRRIGMTMSYVKIAEHYKVEAVERLEKYRASRSEGLPAVRAGVASGRLNVLWGPIALRPKIHIRSPLADFEFAAGIMGGSVEHVVIGFLAFRGFAFGQQCPCQKEPRYQ